MAFTADRIDSDKNLIPSLLKLFPMFKIGFWYNPREDEIKYIGGKISIRCSYFEKETIIDVDILDTTYQDIITILVLNTMLHRVGMLWIFETNEQLQYDMEK